MVAEYRRTLYQIELLTEGAAPESLSDVQYEMTEGHASGEFSQVSSEAVRPLVMGRLLINQRSDPDFLLNADGYEDERLCPDCEERGSPKHDNGNVVLYECLNEDCDQEDPWEVPRWRDEDWDAELTRTIEFLGLCDDGMWKTFITEVPVHIRWDGLQDYADNTLLSEEQYRRFFKIIPWNESPE